MLDIIDQEQKLFGYASQFEKFVKLQKGIQPFSEMWKSIGMFLEAKRRWLKGPIADLDAAEVENNIRAQLKTTQKLVKSFKSESIPFKVASEF
jgi:dynein heavy chain